MLGDNKGVMMNHTDEPGHGNSVAAWTTVSLVLVAFSVGTLFFFLDNAPLVWASAALAAIAPVVGLVLKRAGYGVGGSRSKSH